MIAWQIVQGAALASNISCWKSPLLMFHSCIHQSALRSSVMNCLGVLLENDVQLSVYTFRCQGKKFSVLSFLSEH